MNTDRKSPDNGSSAADPDGSTTPAATSSEPEAPASNDPPAPTPNEPVPAEASADAAAERPSMAELERELAELLDEAPLLPEDDDEGSGVDFVPPQDLAARPHESAPPVEAHSVASASDAASIPTSTTAPAPRVPPTAPAPVTPQAPQAPVAPQAPPQQAPPQVLPAAVPVTHARQPVSARQPIAAREQNESDKTLPAARKSKRALVTTLVVAAVLVIGRLVTWPSDAYQARQSNVAASSARLHTDPRGVGSAAPAPLGSAIRAPSASASAETAPVARAAEAGAPDAARAFSVVDMLTALAPAGIEAGRCRHTGDSKGRAYVRVNIAAGGSIESVFAGHAYKDSETAACIERKIRAAKLPPFAGEGGSVVLPIDLR